jgi:hypothetical protein
MLANGSLQPHRTMNTPYSPRTGSADDSHQTLRALGARAHQLRATTRAADHFSGRSAEADRNTGAWLMSSAVAMAEDLAAEIDSLARALKEGPPEPALQQQVSGLRVRAHQLHAAARAADHFLEQDSHEDRDTGSWLIAAALGLSTKLASEIDDSAVPARRRAPAANGLAEEPHEAQLARRIAAAASPVAGL